MAVKFPGGSKMINFWSVRLGIGSSCEVYSRGIVGLTLEAWLDACRGLSLPFSRHEAKIDRFQERWLVATLWLCQTLLLKMAIEIVDFPIEHGNFS